MKHRDRTGGYIKFTRHYKSDMATGSKCIKTCFEAYFPTLQSTASKTKRTVKAVWQLRKYLPIAYMAVKAYVEMWLDNSKFYITFKPLPRKRLFFVDTK